jgi:hypothetical protein
LKNIVKSGLRSGKPRAKECRRRLSFLEFYSLFERRPLKRRDGGDARARQKNIPHKLRERGKLKIRDIQNVEKK